MVFDFYKELIEKKCDNEDDEVAYLSACIKTCGSLKISSKLVGVELSFSEYDIAFHIASLLKRYLGKSIELKAINQDVGKNKVNSYVLSCNGTVVVDFLARCCILNVEQDGDAFLSNTRLIAPSMELFRHYMRGVLVSRCRLTIPTVDNKVITQNHSNAYRLEIKNLSEDIAQDILERLLSQNISLRIKSGNDSAMLYSTDSNQIADLLAFVGANRAVMTINGSLVVRSIKSKLVREMNCSLANLDKVLAAGENIRNAVEKLKMLGRFNELDKATVETCMMKIDNMDMSLEKIATELGISKSAVNHRIRKVIELANSY